MLECFFFAVQTWFRNQNVKQLHRTGREGPKLLAAHFPAPTSTVFAKWWGAGFHPIPLPPLRFLLAQPRAPCCAACRLPLPKDNRPRSPAPLHDWCSTKSGAVQKQSLGGAGGVSCAKEGARGALGRLEIVAPQLPSVPAAGKKNPSILLAQRLSNTKRGKMICSKIDSCCSFPDTLPQNRHSGWKETATGDPGACSFVRSLADTAVLVQKSPKGRCFFCLTCF